MIHCSNSKKSVDLTGRQIVPSMIITYLGGEFVKLQFGDTVLAINPPSKESSLKGSRFGADIVLSTLNHRDMNGFDTVSHGDRKPFEVRGAGEYEIQGVGIRGFETRSGYGVEKEGKPERLSQGETRTGKLNTVYTIRLEGMKLCFLGALSSPELPEKLKEELDDIDILFVPIGGEGVLTPQEAEKLCVSLEPRLIIPIHFAGLGESNALKQFLKEAGEEKTEQQEKLTIKKKDLEGKEAEIIVLKAGQ
ncbi:MAG: MBL fold metallo-hydrolase [bacterium]|nr:MBL fold metallo-hydrolase [bacterium]